MKPRVPETHRIRVDCTGYPADSIKVSISADKRSLTVSAREGDNTDPDKDYSFKEFKIIYGLPANADTLRMSSSLKENGDLIVDVPFIINKHVKTERFDSKINEKKVHFDDNDSKIFDSKIVAFEEKPLEEEDQILTRITEQNFYKKIKISEKGTRFNSPLEKESNLENDDTDFSRMIPIEMTSGIKSNSSNYVTIPIQIVNRNKN
ncbi:hypothetical protein BpHYR1_037732 [Brachionus plicatilis]|uniref:SHSP domain-containing protein n=1 Tax=Brachionus plicatilis TaxID=10195 RepID=A0A3M7SB96_BRAPC|nr:hypothetical protein BpHYR1_037732 [Brachionus plicatilis]